MIDAAILFLAALIGYSFLRSHGGEGLNIKAQLAPPSTPQGRKDRIVGAGALAIMIAAFLFVAIRHQNSDSSHWTIIVVPFGIGAAIFLFSWLRHRK